MFRRKRARQLCTSLITETKPNGWPIAVQTRFRPLVATTLTTIAGLLPLALLDPFWESLAVTIIGGLVSSTILVLVALPFFWIALEQRTTSA